MNNNFMEQAIKQARLAERRSEVPVGAVLVYQDNILTAAGNEIHGRFDPTAHAEILVIRNAAQILAVPRLSECDLYVTLEPCPMCAQAIAFARIRRVYFGAYDPKGGGVEHNARIFNQPSCNHIPEVIGGICEKECSELLVDFFKDRR